ncbi:MAG: Gfo/Idh/MocA family oxidoreductase [Isosphaeraceae bacterium]
MIAPMSRRSLLQKTAVAGVAAGFTIVPRHVLGGVGYVAPSEKMNIAGIGIGGMGAENLKNLKSENIVALCDVDPTYAAPTIQRYSSARFYTDYRAMLDRRKDIDGVVIATPDHTHAVITMAAIRAGKHVYCQKPLTHDVHEARMLAKAASGSKVVTQMGIQGHSGEGIRQLSEWIWAGLIGEVREVDAWCSLTYYPWGHAYWSSKWSERPKEEPPVPKALDWDLWIGPAPLRPYHRAYHPATWRCWWDFGCGMMGDRGVHTLDPIVSALKLTAPTSVDATCCGSTKEVHPLAAVVTFQFPARGCLPPVKLTWYEGLEAPRPPELEDGAKMPAEGGAIIKGTKGTIMSGLYGFSSPQLLPACRMKQVELPKPVLPRVQGSHEMDWGRACKSGGRAGADFSYSGPLTETCLLGNIAKRVESRIVWDADNLRITNNQDANKYVRAEYRQGWSL